MKNKPKYINDYCKIAIDHSDHSMISVDLSIKVPKLQNNTITSRDLRKIWSSPQSFLSELAMIQWESFKAMEDVDDME